MRDVDLSSRGLSLALLLSSLEDDFTQEEKSTIVDLDISNNNIDNLDDHIVVLLPNLERIILTNNPLLENWDNVVNVLSQFQKLTSVSLGSDIPEEKLEKLHTAVPCTKPQNPLRLTTKEQDTRLEEMLQFYLVLRTRIDNYFGHSVHQETDSRSPRRGFYEEQIDSLELLFNKLSESLVSEIAKHESDEHHLNEIITNYKLRLYHRYMKISSKLRQYIRSVESVVPIVAIDDTLPTPTMPQAYPSDFSDDIALFKELLVKKEPTPTPKSAKLNDSIPIEVADVFKLLDKGSNSVETFKDKSPAWKKIITLLGVYIFPFLIWLPNYFKGGWRSIIFTKIKGDVFSSITIAMVRQTSTY